MARLRAVFFVAGMVAAFQGAHAFSGVGDACIQSCDDDAPDGTCPPDCTDCVCCAHQAPVVVTTFTLEPPSSDDRGRFVIDADDQPLSADPREVMHIPKSLAG